MQPRQTPDHIGRIRLNETEARVLYRLVVAERFRVLWARQDAADDGSDLHAFQRQLVHLTKIYRELMLLAEQKDWNIGQPLESDPKGSDPQLPQAPSRRVG